jgi:hypothetical protein
MGQKINILMDQGATFATTFNLVDSSNNALDLSYFSSEAQMRINYSSQNAYTFFANSFSNGSIVISMNAATTTSIPSGRYVYDVKLTDNAGNVSRVVEGMVTVTPAVSI